jgi:hypothetical protein
MCAKLSRLKYLLNTTVKHFYWHKSSMKNYWDTRNIVNPSFTKVWSHQNGYNTISSWSYEQPQASCLFDVWLKPSTTVFSSKILNIPWCPLEFLQHPQDTLIDSLGTTNPGSKYGSRTDKDLMTPCIIVSQREKKDYWEKKLKWSSQWGIQRVKNFPKSQEFS